MEESEADRYASTFTTREAGDEASVGEVGETEVGEKGVDSGGD